MILDMAMDFLDITLIKHIRQHTAIILLGNVSMDNISLDCEEDEVCLFNDVKELAKINNTISYEITYLS